MATPDRRTQGGSANGASIKLYLPAEEALAAELQRERQQIELVRRLNPEGE